jgi:quinoprotein glucose dehydrogenase
LRRRDVGRTTLGVARTEGRRAAAPRLLSGRASYWTDGKAERCLTPGFQLVALDAKTGQRVAGFGREGRVDLKEPAIIGGGQRIDPVTGEIGVNNTPLVVGDVVIVGSAFSEQSGTSPTTHNNTKGLVQAYDVRTGKRLWVFRTIPMPGEFGNDTWEKDSWAVNGNNGVWTQMAADPELGLVYLPVETPTSDYYGGHRPGNNLFAESVVALDVKTGQRRWHYQLVHHPLWGFDNASPPILADITVDGKPVKALAQPGKQSFLYVLDRATGRPVWPIEERPVPAGDVPGEWYAPTQPFPTKPPAYDRQGYADDDLIDFTPRRAAAQDGLALQARPTSHRRAAWTARWGAALSAGSGGTNGGSAYDPEMHVVYVPSQTPSSICGPHPESRPEQVRPSVFEGHPATGWPGRSRRVERRRPSARETALRSHFGNQHGPRRDRWQIRAGRPRTTCALTRS